LTTPADGFTIPGIRRRFSISQDKQVEERKGGMPMKRAIVALLSLLCLIDICINNGIIGVQKENAYAQTKGKRRPIGRPAQASLGLAGFWSFSQRRGTTNWIECQFGYALAGCLAAGWSEGFEGAFLSRPPLEAGRKTT
jgi:uncharacterized membrane protein YuzA (DUF378 family)